MPMPTPSPALPATRPGKGRLGPAALPPWSNVYEGPRYLSDDGSRFFFESFDALALGDENIFAGRL